MSVKIILHEYKLKFFYNFVDEIGAETFFMLLNWKVSSVLIVPSEIVIDIWNDLSFKYSSN